MLDVVERTTGGLMYDAALSATPAEAAPETRAGYAATRSATAETPAMTGSARRSAWRAYRLYAVSDCPAGSGRDHRLSRAWKRPSFQAGVRGSRITCLLLGSPPVHHLRFPSGEGPYGCCWSIAGYYIPLVNTFTN